MRKIILPALTGALFLGLGGFVAQQTIGYDQSSGSICAYDKAASPTCVPFGFLDSTNHVFGLSSPVRVGTTASATPYSPRVANAVTTTGSITSGSTALTVLSSTGIANGDTIIASGIPSGAYVVSGAGTTSLVMSKSATVTNSTASIQFGNNRWTTGSTITADTIGATNLFIGSAAQGHSTWLNKFQADAHDYPEVSSLVAINGHGANAALFGARMSDQTTGLNAIETVVSMALVDVNPSGWPSWVNYEQAKLMAGAVGAHISTENSIQSYWPTVDEDPYDYNTQGRTVNLRLDSGVGTHAIGVDPKPNDISAYIDLVWNDARAKAGIVVGQGSLDTDDGRIAPALALPSGGYSVSWYRAAATRAWDLYSTASWSTHSIRLTDDGMVLDRPSTATPLSYGLANAGIGIWSIGMTSDTNYDFVVARSDTSGTYQDIPLRIRDSDGLVMLADDVALGRHVAGSGSTPTISSCGSSASITGNDIHGTIVGGLSTSSCAITWAVARSSAPDCVISSPTGNVVIGYTPTPTGLTITSASLSGPKWTYQCMGR